MWSKLDGKADFYLVETENLKKQVNTTDLTFDGLMPGNCYTFTVKSGVPTQWSKEANISSCTKPGKVSNLNATKIEDTSLTVSWENPEGKFIGFNVTVKFSDKEQTYIVSETKLTLTDLQEGTKTTIQVVVLSIHNLMGDVTEISTYTVPGRVRNLELTAGQTTITATWNYTVIGSDTKFIAKLYLSNTEIKNETLNNTAIEFSNLKTATNYTVEVTVVKGNVSSPKETRSIFTLPTAPTDLKATIITKNTITLTWKVPEEITSATFIFNVSSHWNKTYTERVERKTSYTFENLVSGTRYDFTVHAEAGNVTSGSVNYSIQTEPEKIDITLSMLCNSIQPLYCAKNTQRKSVLEQETGSAYYNL
ncbi:receptor-type tyrosine-protein phosphatase eta-like [Oryzias latipes]|uniref:receptor-type tyrosine-protein phosphatase eta-like n=1 Tax=Oryzias latipes TaxID=8090 RepID=UPI000CE2273C|nr:receptor-type tyrosine-protein phosphatase eta-like [Oryzias latipes]